MGRVGWIFSLQWDGGNRFSLPLLSSKEHCLVHSGLGRVDMLFVPYEVT